MGALDLGIVIAYMAGMLLLGFVVSRRIHGFRDYFIAGGRMGTPLLVCTLVSTYYGLDVLFGGSEVGFIDGVVGWFFYTRPYYVAILITGFVIARSLRRNGFLSMPDVAERTYGRGTQAVVALASFVYALPLLAIMGIGVLLDVVLGVPFVWGVLLGAGVSLAYTVMGGLLADAMTDTVQFTLMCVTLGIAAALVLEDVGGIEGMQRALPASYFEPRGTYPSAVLIVFSLGALSVFVEPAFYQRIFAAKSGRSVLAALVIGVVLWAAFDWIVTLLGMAAAATGIDAEPRYALLTITLDALPVGLAGLFVAGVIATAMSTIDSYLLIAGGNLSYDLYRPLARRPPEDAQLLRLTRWMIVVAAVASVVLALVFTSMVGAWVFMSSVLVATAFVPILAALWRPGAWKPAAGFSAATVGLCAVVLAYALISLNGTPDEEWGTRIWRLSFMGRDVSLWQEYAVLFALPSSLVAFVLGQLFGRRTA